MHLYSNLDFEGQGQILFPMEDCAGLYVICLCIMTSKFKITFSYTLKSILTDKVTKDLNKSIRYDKYNMIPLLKRKLFLKGGPLDTWGVLWFFSCKKFFSQLSNTK